jgi:hypothetical protein
MAPDGHFRCGVRIVLALVEQNFQSRGGFLMKLAATHEPPRDVGRLQRGALSG